MGGVNNRKNKQLHAVISSDIKDIHSIIFFHASSLVEKNVGGLCDNAGLAGAAHVCIIEVEPFLVDGVLRVGRVVTAMQ